MYIYSVVFYFHFLLLFKAPFYVHHLEYPVQRSSSVSKGVADSFIKGASSLKQLPVPLLLATRKRVFILQPQFLVWDRACVSRRQRTTRQDEFCQHISQKSTLDIKKNAFNRRDNKEKLNDHCSPEPLLLNSLRFNFNANPRFVSACDSLCHCLPAMYSACSLECLLFYFCSTILVFQLICTDILTAMFLSLSTAFRHLVNSKESR